VVLPNRGLFKCGKKWLRIANKVQVVSVVVMCFLMHACILSFTGADVSPWTQANHQISSTRLVQDTIADVGEGKVLTTALDCFFVFGTFPNEHGRFGSY